MTAAEATRRKRLESAIDEQGREFMRRAVIAGMESLGYRVADDLRTIDLSKPGEVLLQVPGQENAISMRFPDRDGFAYRFLIPEAPSDIQAAARNRKLDEMKSACGDCLRVVESLRAAGIPLELQAAAGVNAESLRPMTEEQRARLESRTATNSARAAPTLRTKE